MTGILTRLGGKACWGEHGESPGHIGHALTSFFSQRTQLLNGTGRSPEATEDFRLGLPPSVIQRLLDWPQSPTALTGGWQQAIQFPIVISFFPSHDHHIPYLLYVCNVQEVLEFREIILFGKIRECRSNWGYNSREDVFCNSKNRGFPPTTQHTQWAILSLSALGLESTWHF